MFTIRIGNKKIKLLNWLIFLIFVFLIIYIVGLIFFMLPIFTKTYNYKLEKENYVINSKVTFKNVWFTCKEKQEYVIKAEDKDIYNVLEKDLINDGFKKRKNKLIKISKSLGTCKDDRITYDKQHSSKYVLFKLNGKKEENLIYGNNYVENYVIAKINNKKVKNIIIKSNLNENKVGKYIISYTINISPCYKQRLYRKVNVIDDEKPVISLIGEKEMEIEYKDVYKEPGYSATDNYDGNITNKVNVKNKINSKKPGTYELVYSVKDSSSNNTSIKRIVKVKEKEIKTIKEKPQIKIKDGITYVNGVLLVNKTHCLPKDYDPKVNKTALKALKNMQSASKVVGLNLPLISGYRSYKTQNELYKKYVKKDGEEKANTYSAKPGCSEHQTGLAFDIGKVDSSFANTNEAKWIMENAHLYGFIVRYPKDKTNVTGYIYEPWHVRYLGVDIATKVWKSDLTLEEYLGIN